MYKKLISITDFKTAINLSQHIANGYKFHGSLIPLQPTRNVSRNEFRAEITRIAITYKQILYADDLISIFSVDKDGYLEEIRESMMGSFKPYEIDVEGFINTLISLSLMNERISFSKKLCHETIKAYRTATDEQKETIEGILGELFARRDKRKQLNVIFDDAGLIHLRTRIPFYNLHVPKTTNNSQFEIVNSSDKPNNKIIFSRKSLFKKREILLRLSLKIDAPEKTFIGVHPRAKVLAARNLNKVINYALFYKIPFIVILDDYTSWDYMTTSETPHSLTKMAELPFKSGSLGIEVPISSLIYNDNLPIYNENNS